ncbi:hypothetical protein VTI74DRAFT_6714 [Chaetomium olivicolor]
MSGITKLDLWQSGISIDQNQAQKGALPHHVDELRNTLLDYGCDIPEHLVFKSAEDESRRLNDIAKVLYVSESERASINFCLTQLKDIKWKAEKLDKDGDYNWEPFFSKHFFDTLLYQMGKAGAKSDSIYYYNEYLEYSTSLSRPWSLFEQEDFRQDGREGLPVPKPDWVSSYTVYNIPKDSIQENLSYGELQHLAQHGLESDASCTLASEKSATYPDRDWVCFPWLIVQHGKPGGTETQCHYEAANAATAAVMMLERLCKVVPAGIQGKTNEHVPPVVAITTVKKMVRVWITYSCRPSVNDAAKFKMACIWKGDMTAILDLMKFSAILCNAHKWALHEQRPRISGYIDLWKARYPMGSRSTAKEEEPETLPGPKTITTISSGSKPSSLGNIEPRDTDRLLDLLEVYQGILKEEWRERQRLMAQVNEMQQRLQDFVERRDSCNPSSPPSQPVQQTGTQQSSLDGKSAATKPMPTPPQPQFITTLNSSSKSPQVSSARPEIFEKGIRLHCACHPERTIRVRLPKPPPTTSKTTTDRNPTFKLPMSALTQTTARDMKFPVLGGQLPASQNLPEFRLATPLPKVDQSVPVSVYLPKFKFAGPLPKVKPPAFKFDFAGPLPKVEPPAFKFDFAPLSTAKDTTPGFTSALFSGPPTEKDKAPVSSPNFFSSPSMAKEKDNKTANSSSVPFSTSPKSNGKTPSVPSPTRARCRDLAARDDSTPKWRSPISSEGEGEDGGKPTSPTPQTATAPEAATRRAPDEVTAHTRAEPASKPTIPKPLKTGPTPEAEANRYTTPEPIQQPGDDDGKYDAEDEEDEEWEDEASDRDTKSRDRRNGMKGAVVRERGYQERGQWALFRTRRCLVLCRERRE